MAALLVAPGMKQFNGVGFSNWSFRLKLQLEQHGVLDVVEKIERWNRTFWGLKITGSSENRPSFTKLATIPLEET
ncbi:hypothetical protein GE061_008486 [Apolygus lucorum]|uniref:DUF4219 domain-containing protein n=1 Tax=Apolygus lucorum TaxID=248454 RepID=A0A8S9WJR6_APOLU|nr:hypothetical protein GE061_008486 [Apolygus lucorum]